MLASHRGAADTSTEARVIGRFLVPLAIVLGIFVYMRDGSSQSAAAHIEQACGAVAGTVNVTIDAVGSNSLSAHIQA